jgi:hypothetical protein
MSGFTNAGAGKLIGPDGQEMDNEAFLSDLASKRSYKLRAGGAFSGDWLLQLIIQSCYSKYGKGIVQYGSTIHIIFPWFCRCLWW